MSVGAELRTNTAPKIATVVATVDYYIAVVLRDTGAYFFEKEITGSPVWIYTWRSLADATATLYPCIGVHQAWGAGNNVHEFLRVPDVLWLPTPKIYDTFTGANGTSLDAHASDSTGPDSQAAPSLTGVEESGDWDIQSNRANPDGAGLHVWEFGVANAFVELTVNGGTAGGPGIVLRFTDPSNFWYVQADRANNKFETHEVNASVDTVRANAAVVINNNTDYNIKTYCHGQGIAAYLNGNNRTGYGPATLNEGATKHGLFSDNTACEFDDFLLFSRNGEYGKLDTYL
jgi:hypothetical protein